MDQPDGNRYSPPVVSSAAVKRLTVRVHPRKVTMYQVTEDEIDSIATSSRYQTLDVSMFTLFAGALITLVITLLTVDMPDGKPYSAIVAATLACAAGALFFGIRAALALRAGTRAIERLKRPIS